MSRKTITPVLTPRRVEVLGIIQQYIKTNGFAPSVREISAAIGSAHPAGAQAHLSALRRLGLVARRDGISRSLHVTPEGRKAMSEVKP